MIEIKQVGKEFHLIVNGWLLGVAKLECDAQMHKHKLEEAMKNEECYRVTEKP